MEAINMAVNEGRRAGVPRMKKHSLRTDMTPMVDLGFLLITFFVITAEMNKPTVTSLVMPKEGIDMLVPNSDALTVLLGKKDKVFYYEGAWTEAVSADKIIQTSLSHRDGLGDVIRQKQKRLDADPARKEGRNGLMLIISPGSEAAYKTLIDILDEVLINDIKKYAITKPGKEEINWLQKQ